MFPVLRCATVIALIVQLGCSANPTTAPLRYPAARTVDVVDDYHGSKVPDPYRWLEEPDSQEVVGWAAAQTEVAKSLLRQNDIRPWLLTRVAELQQFSKVCRERQASTSRCCEAVLTRSLNRRSVDPLWAGRSADKRHGGIKV